MRFPHHFMAPYHPQPTTLMYVIIYGDGEKLSKILGCSAGMPLKRAPIEFLYITTDFGELWRK